MKENQLERYLKAVANRRRLAILKYLKLNREAPVGEIAGAIHLSLKATSKHLGILASADILAREQRSKEMYYSNNSPMPAVVHRVTNFL